MDQAEHGWISDDYSDYDGAGYPVVHISRGGENSADDHLDRMTCDFCRDIIKYALRFRMMDEEDFLSNIPQFHMEKEDIRGDLAKRAQRCKTCAMVWSAINDSYARATSRWNASQDSSDSEVWWEFGRPRSKYDRPMLFVVDSVTAGACFKFREKPWISLQSLERANEVLATGSQYASYHVLRRWYDKCLDHAGNTQDVSIVNDIQSTTIRLIDVDDNCLCDVPTSAPYLALSYVWGTAPDDADKLLTRNFRQLYRHNGLDGNVSLTRTVRDAIEVTKGLRFKYLFVDRLCIIQDDSDDMAAYVNSMHEIYNKANITIVAASGASARDGLPGTRGTPRTKARLFHPRQSITIEGRSLVRVHEDEFPPGELLDRHVNRSVWATRGWTYQEQKLSERMLLFTDQAVFWKCSHICLYEDCPHDQHEHLSNGLVNMRLTDAFGRGALWWWFYQTRGRQALGNDNGKDIGGNVVGTRDRVTGRVEQREKLENKFVGNTFRLRVEEFCHRRLTNQGDIARAFSGIIEAFKLIHAPLDIHHGLITRSLLSELTWACVDCADRRHTEANKHTGLRTIADTTGVPAFPSWSWYASSDRPTWTYGRRGTEESLRELDQTTSMTTSIYTGTSNRTEARLLFQERRPVEWRQQGGGITPAPWMLQHRLRQRALIFAALVVQLDPEVRWASGPRHTSLNTLADLGLRVPESADVAIVDWLQTPTEEAFQRPVGLMCLAIVDESSGGSQVTKSAVLMLLSYRTVDGRTVAFREGLFTLALARYKPVEPYFAPKMVFLC